LGFFWRSAHSSFSAAFIVRVQHMHGVEPADIPPALLARMMLV
jgi:hypothetical protein